MAEESARAGYSPEYLKREKPMRCSGVGTGSQSTDWNVRHRICLGDGRLVTFESPELPDSKTPALLGQHSMKEKRALIDTFTGKLYLVGSGGYARGVAALALLACCTRSLLRILHFFYASRRNTVYIL